MRDDADRLLTPGEVADLYRVTPQTASAWATAGRLHSIKTPGGHHRFRESEIRALLEGQEPDHVEDRIPRPLRSGDRAGPPPPPLPA